MTDWSLNSSDQPALAVPRGHTGQACCDHAGLFWNMIFPARSKVLAAESLLRLLHGNAVNLWIEREAMLMKSKTTTTITKTTHPSSRSLAATRTPSQSRTRASCSCGAATLVDRYGIYKGLPKWRMYSPHYACPLGAPIVESESVKWREEELW